MAENESLAKKLDELTGGTSEYDAGTGTWNLSASTQGAVDRYLEQRDYAQGRTYGGYDASKDPAYSALKKEYLREADRGTEDTMGTYAGLTGGIPSTAAVTAAQQAGDYYRGQLADRQVELGEQDYNKWLTETELENDLAEKYRTQAEASAESLAALGDFSAMGKLYGWTDEQIANARNQWLSEQYSSSSGSSGGGSSGSSSDETTYNNGKSDSEIAQAAANLALSSNRYLANSASLDSWLKSNGYSGNSAAKFKEYYTYYLEQVAANDSSVKVYDSRHNPNRPLINMYDVIDNM